MKTWEERFDQIEFTGEWCDDCKVMVIDNKKQKKFIKDLLTSELQKQKEEIVEMIKRMRLPEDMVESVFDTDDEGRAYNRCIDDIIKKIGGK